MNINPTKLKSIYTATSEIVGKTVKSESPAVQNPERLIGSLDALAASARASVSFKGGMNRVAEYITSLPPKVAKFLKKGENLPEAVKKDLEKIEKSKGDLKDVFVPSFAKKEDALAQCEIGDVFQLGSNKNIFYKTSDGASVQLNMDKDTYFELFPPVLRFANVQHEIGNCYEVTALNQMMKNPESRLKILQSFQQKKDGLYFAFPTGNSAPIRLDRAEILAKNQTNKYSVGCEGIKLTEYALGKSYEQEFIEYNKRIIQAKKKANGIKDNVNHPLNTELRKLDELLTKQTDSKARARHFGLTRPDDLGVSLRSAHVAPAVWEKFGLQESKFYYNVPPSGESAVDKIFEYELSAKNPNPVNYEKIISRNRQLQSGQNPVEDVKTIDYINASLNGAKDIESPKEFEEALKSKEFWQTHLVDAQANYDGVIPELTAGHSYSIRPIYDKAGNISEYAILDPLTLEEKKYDFDSISLIADTISASKI